MNVVISLLVFGFTCGAALPTVTRQSNILGGSVTVISQYPSVVALLYSPNYNNFNQACGGTIITSSSIVTAAHCAFGDAVSKWRARVGSSWANSGGSIYNLRSVVIHPGFNVRTFDNDAAILRTASPIIYSNVVIPASIAGTTYNLVDNQVVWAVGWGTTVATVSSSEQLRHIQVWTINQVTCVSRYAIFGANVTANMLCSGWLNSGGRDQCQGNSGGPLYHNGILVGISSWGYGCANAVYPDVSARVSQLATWIQSNA